MFQLNCCAPPQSAEPDLTREEGVISSLNAAAVRVWKSSFDLSPKVQCAGDVALNHGPSLLPHWPRHKRGFPAQHMNSFLQLAFCSKNQIPYEALSRGSPCLTSAWNWNMMCIPFIIGQDFHCAYWKAYKCWYQTLPDTNSSLITY